VKVIPAPVSVTFYKGLNPGGSVLMPLIKVNCKIMHKNSVGIKTGNTLPLRYKDQPVNAVREIIAVYSENIRNTQIHIVSKMQDFSMLN
jgi:hypothetical protein